MLKKSQKILIASDHAGYNLKAALIKFLTISKYSNIEDLGCDSSENAVDYPDFAKKMAKKIQNDEVGILICGSGIGISIAANRFLNIRAALCVNEEMAILSRLHNDANVICFGARMISEGLAIKILQEFLATDFEGKRHKNRVEKINDLS